MATQSIKEFIVKLNKQVKDTSILLEPLRIAAFTTTAKMGERIFDDGRTTIGSSIGQYSTTPIYVNPNKLTVGRGSLGVPRGKTGETRFKSGKKEGQRHKTKYLEGGYKEFRQKVGRQTAFVDLSLSNELRLDFGNGRMPAEPRKVSDFEYHIRLDKVINQEKRSGMEDKYGTIFTPSEQEEKTFFDTVDFEFRKRLNAAAA